MVYLPQLPMYLITHLNLCVAFYFLMCMLVFMYVGEQEQVVYRHRKMQCGQDQKTPSGVSLGLFLLFLELAYVVSLQRPISQFVGPQLQAHGSTLSFCFYGFGFFFFFFLHQFLFMRVLGI